MLAAKSSMAGFSCGGFRDSVITNRDHDSPVFCIHFPRTLYPRWCFLLGCTGIESRCRDVFFCRHISVRHLLYAQIRSTVIVSGALMSQKKDQNDNSNQC